LIGYPKFFQPNSSEAIELKPSGKRIIVAKAQVTFNKWLGDMPTDTYGNKAVIAWQMRKPAFAELAILWEFQSAGWHGRWIDSYRNKFRTGYWQADCLKDLPPEQMSFFVKIRKVTGRRGGCFDVFCWHGEDLCFIEAKRRGKDQFRDSQRYWLEAALSVGVKMDQLLIVEWAIR
jgi:hypothetical protein